MLISVFQADKHLQEITLPVIKTLKARSAILRTGIVFQKNYKLSNHDG